MNLDPKGLVGTVDRNISIEGEPISYRKPLVKQASAYIMRDDSAASRNNNAQYIGWYISPLLSAKQFIFLDENVEDSL